MEETDIKICRVCLTVNTNLDHCMIDGELSNMLDLFLPKSPFIVYEPSICRNCVALLEIGYNFKLNCINNEEKIQTYVNSLKIDFHIYRINPETKCCFCLDTDSSFDKICALDKYLKAYLPEFDLMKLSDAVVCNSCIKIVQSTYNFIKSYLEVERKIGQYMSAQNVTEINLNNVLNYLKITDNAKAPYEDERNQELSESNKSGEIASSNGITKTEIINKSSHQIEIHYFQDFSENLNMTDCLQAETLFKENVYEHFEPHYLEALNPPVNSNINQDVHEDETANLTVNEMSPKKLSCKICGYIASTKNELKYHFFDHKKTLKMYSCEVCSFVTRHKNVIDNHNLTHLADEEVVWHNCNMCTYRSRIQGNLEKHKFTHNKQTDELKKYKCEECPYKTMWKRDLERHIVKHNETVVSCDHCAFSTKHQRYLKQHIIKVHGTKENSSGETYYCANCDYNTKSKRCLAPHMLTHRNTDNLEWHKCQVCKYKSKWKTSLKVHEVIHIKKFKCNQCDFETTLKRFLKEHLRGHLPMTLYSCEICDFTTHVKQTMSNHNSKKHRNPDELPTFYCTHCKYKTKRLPDLRQHSLLHKDNPEWLVCSSCSYRTICKKRLKSHHKIMHGESSKIKRFQCSLCPFTTKYKASLTNHQMCLHQKKDESTLIKCSKCYYECHRKDLLARHLLVHKKVSEEEMFRCYHCNYKTKYKRALIRHVKGHQNTEKKDIIIKCSECDYTTKWPHCMKKHMRKHPEDTEEFKMEIDVAKTEIQWRPADVCFSSDIKENM